MNAIKKSLLPLLFILFFCHCEERQNKNGIDLKLNILPEITSVNFAEALTLTDRLHVRLNFELKIEDDYKELKKNYMGFVSLIQKNNKTVSFDYPFHFKDVKIKEVSGWKKGDVLHFSKKIYIPKFLDNYGIDFGGFELFELQAGLSLPGSAEKKILLYRKEIRIEAEESHAAEIGYMKGWHGVENNPDAKERDYRNLRWTEQKAECIIDNKNHKESTRHHYSLIIKGGVPKDILKDQRVIIKINNKVLDEFLPEGDSFVKAYQITPLQMGEKETFLLTFETDKTFVPASLNPQSNDKRELGMRIYTIYFRKSV